MLPVTWSVCGQVEVEADSIEEAVENFDSTLYDLPEHPEYVDSSFELSFTDVEAIKLLQS